MSDLQRWTAGCCLVALAFAFLSSGVQQGFALGVACTLAYTLAASERQPPWL